MTNETPKTRISPDVWAQAGAVAQQMGLSNERAAIEAVFRCFHASYTARIAPPSLPIGATTPTRTAPSSEIDCTAALDAILTA